MGENELQDPYKGKTPKRRFIEDEGSGKWIFEFHNSWRFPEIISIRRVD
tara:strand:+ start:444 stop:590 length:147 start_codon:yes stop_codon:yes gene_type:complete